MHSNNKKWQQELERYKGDAAVIHMLLEYSDHVDKPLILMDSLNAMTFKKDDGAYYCEPELVEPGTKIDIIGELRDPETGDVIGNKAQTVLEQVIKNDNLTWDMLVIEGDDAIYAGLGIDRRLELIRDPIIEKDDFEIGGR